MTYIFSSAHLWYYKKKKCHAPQKAFSPLTKIDDFLILLLMARKVLAPSATLHAACSDRSDWLTLSCMHHAPGEQVHRNEWAAASDGIPRTGDYFYTRLE